MSIAPETYNVELDGDDISVTIEGTVEIQMMGCEKVQLRLLCTRGTKMWDLFLELPKEHCILKGRRYQLFAVQMRHEESTRSFAEIWAQDLNIGSMGKSIQFMSDHGLDKLDVTIWVDQTVLEKALRAIAIHRNTEPLEFDFSS